MNNIDLLEFEEITDNKIITRKQIRKEVARGVRKLPRFHCGKTGYQTLKIALGKQNKTMLELRKNESKKIIRVYKCYRCHYFHLTHQPQGDKRYTKA